MTSDAGRDATAWTCPKCGPGFVVTPEQAASHERLCDGPEPGREAAPDPLGLRWKHDTPLWKGPTRPPLPVTPPARKATPDA